MADKTISDLALALLEMLHRYENGGPKPPSGEPFAAAYRELVQTGRIDGSRVPPEGRASVSHVDLGKRALSVTEDTLKVMLAFEGSATDLINAMESAVEKREELSFARRLLHVNRILSARRRSIWHANR